LLRWDTSSEINNDYFEIEVAIGEDAVGNQLFEAIGKVRGMGTTNQEQYYQFVDETPGKSGNRYYRLKQVDYNGGFNYSPIRLVNFSEIDVDALAYPNPFYNHLKLRYNSKVEKRMDIYLVDAQGRKIEHYNEAVVEGTQDILLNIQNQLPAGVYFLQLEDQQKVQTFRLTKVKP